MKLWLLISFLLITGNISFDPEDSYKCCDKIKTFIRDGIASKELSYQNDRIRRDLNESMDETFIVDDVTDGGQTDEEYYNEVLDFIFPNVYTWTMIVFHVVVFVVGLVGNVLVCVAVYRNRAMRTVTNYFIVNLAIADFLVILLCLPPSLVWDVTLTWFFGNVVCKIVLYFQTVSVTVSVLTLTLISIDRWYAICYPLKFKSTRRRAKTAIVIIWIVSLTFDIPELMVYTTVPYKYNRPTKLIYFTQCAPTWSENTDTKWIIAKMVLLYGLPLAFMAAAYMHIIKVLWRSGNSRLHNSSGNNRRFNLVSNASTRGQLRSRKKAAIMLVSVVSMFAFCYFPVHLLSLLRVSMKLTNSDLSRGFSLLAHWLCYANSAVNPLIYNFMSSKFRKEFKRSMKCLANQRNREQVEMSAPFRSTKKTHSTLIATLSAKSETVKTEAE